MADDLFEPAIDPDLEMSQGDGGTPIPPDDDAEDESDKQPEPLKQDAPDPWDIARELQKTNAQLVAQMAEIRKGEPEPDASLEDDLRAAGFENKEDIKWAQAIANVVLGRAGKQFLPATYEPALAKAFLSVQEQEAFGKAEIGPDEVKAVREGVGKLREQYGPNVPDELLVKVALGEVRKAQSKKPAAKPDAPFEPPHRGAVGAPHEMTDEEWQKARAGKSDEEIALMFAAKRKTA
jgi:hypothetical protein